MNLVDRYNKWLRRAKEIHSDKYDYSSVVYVNTHTKVNIRCATHGYFSQTPAMHVFDTGQGCPQCATERGKVKHEVFIDKATTVHGDRYDYSLIDSSNYFNIRSKLPIICNRHGVFHQRGDDHNRGRGCPKCKTVSASRKALTWLDNIMRDQGIHIQHAGNGGEFKIPGTTMYADGYCKQSNTVYEFDGDAFHGNPSRYSPDYRCHPFDKSVTARQLCDATIAKHNAIRQLGFSLVVIWESDFDQLNLRPINQYHDVVQNKIDNDYPMLLSLSGLQIVGQYTGAKDQHQLQCMQCNHVFTATPISKVQTKRKSPDAYGCPLCNKAQTAAKNKKRGNYEQRLLALGYECSGYINAGIKCTMTCVHCGQSKHVTPSAIIQRNKPCCEG